MPDNDKLPLKEAMARAMGHARGQIEFMLGGRATEVAHAMRYAVEGGKGLRAFLVAESALLHDIERGKSAPAAGAIEALHAYSLVHDDLPCMDDDDLRRGKPTVHRRWSEATAVLAGDALQSLAFQLVLQTDCDFEARWLLAHKLSTAAGLHGMVGGQESDMAAELADRPLTLEEITRLQAGKTGALITWAATAGELMSGENHGGGLHVYGDCLGLAFQIADDILDVEGDVATVGKAVGKDAGRGKATFVSLLGLDGAKRRAADLVAEACDSLETYGDKADVLKQAACFVIARQS